MSNCNICASLLYKESSYYGIIWSKELCETKLVLFCPGKYYANYVRLFEDNTENWWFSRYLHVSVVQRLQLSWNLWDSPRFLEFVLGPGGLCTVIQNTLA